jgi:hypothetical protein
MITAGFIYFSAFAVSETASKINGKTKYEMSITSDAPLKYTIKGYGRIFEIDLNQINSVLLFLNKHPSVKAAIRFPF